ncbi:hypothetical protein K469DRAFT_522057, partial [Zopfia rhizophila CBS 207.26]
IIKPIRTQVYCLLLPPSSQIHPVSNISLLRPYTSYSGEEELMSEPLELENKEEKGQYIVKALLAKKKDKNTLKYLVKWKGWPTQYNKW